MKAQRAQEWEPELVRSGSIYVTQRVRLALAHLAVARGSNKDAVATAALTEWLKEKYPGVLEFVREQGKRADDFEEKLMQAENEREVAEMKGEERKANPQPHFLHSDYRPIHQAAGACDAATVSQILSTNAAALNVTEDGGRGPLHIAAARCCTNVMALLLERGAKLELKGKAGETPLHVAAQEGCVEGVRMLVNKGADLKARDNEGHTPLKRAIDYQQDATVDLLRKFGAEE